MSRIVTLTAGAIGFVLGSRAGREPYEKLAAKAQLLAEGWDRPRDAKDPVDIDDAVPDDSTVDHTGDRFEDE